MPAVAEPCSDPVTHIVQHGELAAPAGVLKQSPAFGRCIEAIPAPGNTGQAPLIRNRVRVAAVEHRVEKEGGQVLPVAEVTAGESLDQTKGHEDWDQVARRHDA